MGLSRSTFYDPPPVTVGSDDLVVRIEAICDKFECYGYRRVGAALRRERPPTTAALMVRGEA